MTECDVEIASRFYVYAMIFGSTVFQLTGWFLIRGTDRRWTTGLKNKQTKKLGGTMTKCILGGGVCYGRFDWTLK